jgi:hypothetical protein
MDIGGLVVTLVVTLPIPHRAFKLLPACLLKWWRDPESNRGHKDFQSSALPTELSRLVEKKGRNKTSEACLVNGKYCLASLTFEVGLCNREGRVSVESGGEGYLGLSGRLDHSLPSRRLCTRKISRLSKMQAEGEVSFSSINALAGFEKSQNTT